MAKILVAEDDRHVRQLLVDTLFDAGYDVIEAKNGKAAVERSPQGASRPGLAGYLDALP